MNIIILPDAEAVGRYVASEISDVITHNPHAVLGLATGSSPITTYRSLIELHGRGLDFSNVTSFNLDEYYGIGPDWQSSADEDQSYARFMWERLFRHINLSDTFIPNGLTPRESIDDHCSEYENLIAEHGGIDYQLLGLGPDGHIAFMMPPSDDKTRTKLTTLSRATLDANYEKFYKKTGKKKDEMPTQAITMGIGTILEYCMDTTMIVLGDDKAEVLRELAVQAPNPMLPATYMKINPRFKIVADINAASLLDIRYHQKLFEKRIQWGHEKPPESFYRISYQ